MARTVSVSITANTAGFTAGMAKASASAKSAAANISKSFDKNQGHIDTLSGSLGKVGLAAGVGIGLAVKSFADFDSAMSGVAATGSDARANLDALKEAAIDAGAKTKYSATEAAGGIEALAKAGVSANDTLGGGLSGALSLAAAGNLDVAGSAEAAASAMNQFGLAGADIPHIADLLAQAAGTAQGEVSDMAGALNQSGLIASQFGLSIDKTSQALALFAKNGLVGSDAGTSFKTMLSSLYAPAGTGAKALDKLGVSAYDAAGALKPIGVVTDDLKAKLDQLSAGDRNAALKSIFGSDAIRAGTILLKDGSAGLAEMATEFGKFGSAADVAAIKMDNLKGDLETLGGAFETALIGLGEGGSGPLRSLVQGVTEAVDSFNDLGDGTKSALLAFGGGIAAVALSAAGIGKVAVFANEAKVALRELGVTAKGASIAVGAVGAVIGIAALGFAAYAANAAESQARVDDFTTALQSQNDAIQQNVTSVAAKQLQDTGAFDAARQLGLSLDTVTQASLGNADAMAKVEAATAGALSVINTPQEFDSNAQDSIAAAQTLQDAVGRTGSEYNEAVSKARDFASATGEASAAVKPDAYAAAADALGKIGTEAGDATGEVQDLTTALFGTADAAAALTGSQIGYEAAVDAAAAAAKKLTKEQKDSGKALSIGNDLGRQNRTILEQQAAGARAVISGYIDQGKSTRYVTVKTQEARDAFIKNAKAMGAGREEAKKLANEAGLIPKKITTEYEAKTGKAKAELAGIKTAIKGLPKKHQAEIIAAFKKGGVDAAKRKLDEVTKKRTAEINAKANGDAAVKRRLDEAARTRKSQIKVTDIGTGGASRDISEAARDRRSQIKAQASGTGAADSALNRVARDRTARINVVTTRSQAPRDNDKGPNNPYTGGLITPVGVMFRGPTRRSNGGPVWGAGTATSDSIPAMLSNGEFVIRAAAVKAVGLATLRDLNAKGYADGGPVGYALGGSVTDLGADGKAILRLMAAILNPLADVNKARRKVEKDKDDLEDAKGKKARRKADGN